MQGLNEQSVLKRMNSGLFSWIDFKKGSNILCVDDSDDSLCFLLGDFNVKYISRISINKLQGKYDYILWRTFDKDNYEIEKVINKLYNILSENGYLYLGFVNNNSVRRKCGDIDFIGKYSKCNIINLFKNTLFSSAKIYSVFPDLYFPQFIISDNFYPNENMKIRYFPIYNHPENINIDERIILDFLISTKKIHEYANCYLVECCKNGSVNNDCQYITLSMDRDDDYACNTILSKEYVTKKYPFDLLNRKIGILKENEIYLNNHNVPIAMSIPDSIYKVPFYRASILTNTLYELLKKDIKHFYKLFDEYRDIVYSSSDIVVMENDTPVLKKCFFDLVPLNCLFVDNKFIFIDQEFYIENMSANLIMWRAVKILYLSYPDTQNYILEKDLLMRYNIDATLAKYYSLVSNDYINKLRNRILLKDFYFKHTASINNMDENTKYKTEHLKKQILNNQQKKYNVGYVAGVFDLFHIGHLNLLRKAKELCNYLIVGVVSDKGVIEYKKTDLFIPFKERIEIVRACKYVDEAHEIPFEHCTSMDAFAMYHFDVQFSGDDYKDDPGWQKVKEYLEKNGSTIIFLPYTKTTSSTKIKDSINKKNSI